MLLFHIFCLGSYELHKCLVNNAVEYCATRIVTYVHYSLSYEELKYKVTI